MTMALVGVTYQCTYSYYGLVNSQTFEAALDELMLNTENVNK